MQRLEISKGLVLDSTGSDGVATEVSRVIEVGANNAIQVQLLIYSLSGTNVSVKVEQSLDRINWSTEKSAQTFDSVGRKLLNADTGVAVPYFRIRFTITGSGKAILDAYAQVSAQ